MKLYAVIDGTGQVLGYHDSKTVVKQFMEGIKERDQKDSLKLVKVLNPKKVKDTSKYLDLYLVKLGNGYIPAMYYDEASIVSEGEIYNYEETVNVISRELEFNSDQLSKEDKKALRRVLKLYEGRIEEIKDTPTDYRAAKEFKQLRDEYEFNLMKDEWDEEDF